MINLTVLFEFRKVWKDKSEIEKLESTYISEINHRKSNLEDKEKLILSINAHNEYLQIILEKQWYKKWGNVPLKNKLLTSHLILGVQGACWVVALGKKLGPKGVPWLPEEPIWAWL